MQIKNKRTKGIADELIGMAARAAVDAAVELLPKVGQIIFAGASRDETLQALDAALRSSREAASLALSVRHEAMRARAEVGNVIVNAPPVTSAPIEPPPPVSFVWEEEKPGNAAEVEDDAEPATKSHKVPKPEHVEPDGEHLQRMLEENEREAKAIANAQPRKA